jgi:hypothetical protein
VIREYTITERQKGETQEHIDICRTCPFSVRDCNGECDYYKSKAKELRQSKRLKKKVIIMENYGN